MRYEVFRIQPSSNRPASKLRVEVDSHAAIFAEHFPGQPVVPGAFTVGLVLACYKRYLQGTSRYALLQRVVFLAPITPGLSLDLDFSGADTPNPATIGFILQTPEAIHCRGIIAFPEEQAL